MTPDENLTRVFQSEANNLADAHCGDQEMTEKGGMLIAALTHLETRGSKNIDVVTIPDELKNIRILTLDHENTYQGLQRFRAGADDSPVVDTATPGDAELQPTLVPNRAAMRLTNWAVHVLPDSARERYAEEFRSDLYEMAAAGLPRRKLVMYAVRLLPRMFSLRRAVSTRRERA